MTQAFQGHREDLIDHIQPDRVYTEKELLKVWNQTTLQPQTIVFLDPELDLKKEKLFPRKGRILAWTKAPSVQWKRWLKDNKIPLTELPGISPEKARAVFNNGIKHLRFTKDAIDWIMLNLEHDGHLSKQRLNHECGKLLLAYPDTQTLTLDQVADILGGSEQKLAARICQAIGTAEAVRLASKIPSNTDAYRLFAYAAKSLQRRDPTWRLLLASCKQEADRLKYDYATAFFLFTLAVYQCHTSTSKTTTLSSNPYIDQILAHSPLSAIPSWGNGNMKAL